MGNKITYELKRSKRSAKNKMIVKYRSFQRHVHWRSSHQSKFQFSYAFPADSKKHQEFDLQLLVSQTHFSPVELKIMKVLFAGHCSQNRLVATKEDCRQIFFRKLLTVQPNFQFSDAHEFVLNAVFNAVNTDGDGYVSFTELATAASSAVHGNFEEKSRLSFRLYDKNGDGVLTREEMRQYIRILNQIGVLKLSTPLQVLRTRGDLADEQMRFIQQYSLVNARSYNPDIDIPGVNNSSSSSGSSSGPGSGSDFNSNSSGSDLLQQQTVPQPAMTMMDQQQQQQQQQQQNLTEELRLGEQQQQQQQAPQGPIQPQAPTQNHILDPGTLGDIHHAPCIMLSDPEIDVLVDHFFGDDPTMDYDRYVSISRLDRHLIEGLGLYDYIFYQNVVQDVSEFLHRPDRYNQSALMHCGSGGTLKPMWVEIRDGVINHCDPTTKSVQRTIIISKIQSIDSETTQFAIRVGNKFVQYRPDSLDDCRRCLMCLLLHFVSQIDNRYDSYSPVRPQSDTWFYPMVDGEETFAMMAHMLLKAKKQVLIAAWTLNPFLYLKRAANQRTGGSGGSVGRSTTKGHSTSSGSSSGSSDSTGGEASGASELPEEEEDLSIYRYDQILLRIARRGVQVYVIMWHEFAMAGMNLSTSMIRQYLVDLHPNIKCIVHPRNLPFSWSHHQKIMVIDQCVAFVGGLDVGIGRWDDHTHRITDYNHLQTRWPGVDYANDTLARLTSIKPMKKKTDAFRDFLDRDMFPRLPWHDVHCVVAGVIASDIASNLISRWNHHNRVDRAEQTISEVNYYDATLSLFEKRCEMNEYIQDLSPKLAHAKVQALRSISLWSGSLRTEHSIQSAMISVIENAQYYIHIENQYFISHTIYSERVENQVAQAIIRRVSRAIEQREVFRVVIILPMHHSGDIYDPSTHQVMKWQRATIEGIFATLHQQFPHADLHNYINFFALVQKGNIHGAVHFSQIYVHAKLLMVDDRIALIGSANINDRSLIGNRDSEIAIIAEQYQGTTSVFNNRRVDTGRTVKSLRKRLWREHMIGDPSMSRLNLIQQFLPATHRGLTVSKTDLLYAASKDIISNAVFQSMMNRARRNSEIYEQVFPHYPSKRHVTLTEYKQDVERYVSSVRSNSYETSEQNRKLLNEVMGHIVFYPREWLAQDQFKKDTRLRVVDDSVFF